MDSKQELREWAKSERSKLDMKVLSEKLRSKLLKTKEYVNAKNVLIFYPLKNEVDLLPLVKDKTKKFYLPKIDGDNLLCCPYCDGDEVCLSCFKTFEPLTQPCEKKLIDTVIVPALACDKEKYRLGYGGGFYDRFLRDYSGSVIVCIPQKLIVKTVFPEEHDKKADIIITEKDD